MKFSDFIRGDEKEAVMMDVMDKAKRQQLRTLALAATPGERSVNGGDDLDIGDDRVYIGDVENAAYIAAANPATILALLDRIDELEGMTPAERAVPEPTDAMCMAGMAAWDKQFASGERSWPAMLSVVYKAMLAAAPGAGGE